ncbi:hypothetical protein SDC9_143732 [bioreactor metagenome]|uniref:Uncharacterized protein n=1 Tax=bioreactor metagenome TaxID=1076179 RepID=A0A645E5A1_9ZZZZ
MDRCLEAQARCHDANRQTRIARGAYRHLVPGEHRTRSIGRQLQIVAIGQQAMLQSDLLRILQHLMHATACLDGARYWQAVIGLEPEPAQLLGQLQSLLHLRHVQQRRLNTSARCL